MRKIKIAVAAIMIAGTSLVFSSCIGSFALSNKVLSWNKSLGNKFVNELVFFCFWVLPVYEITTTIDVIVLNSIEFWSGSNPMTASTKVVDTDQGRYKIDCDGKGYTVTYEVTGQQTRLEFIEDEQTWAFVNAEGELVPFMTFVDDYNVKMLTPSGEMMPVELSAAGVLAYRAATAESPVMMAAL